MFRQPEPTLARINWGSMEYHSMRSICTGHVLLFPRLGFDHCFCIKYITLSWKTSAKKHIFEVFFIEHVGEQSICWYMCITSVHQIHFSVTVVDQDSGLIQFDFSKIKRALTLLWLYCVCFDGKETKLLSTHPISAYTPDDFFLAKERTLLKIK